MRILLDEILFSRERDYYLKTRNDSKKADLIITNHSFLLADLVSDRPVLPPSDYIVIDEGHHFEKVAGQYFGKKIDYATTVFSAAYGPIRTKTACL